MNPSWVRSHWWENDILFSFKGNSLSQERFTLSLALKVGHFWFQASTFLHCDRSRKEQPSLFLLSFVLHFIYLFVSFFCFVFLFNTVQFWDEPEPIILLKRKRGTGRWKNGNETVMGKEKTDRVTEILFPFFTFLFPIHRFVTSLSKSLPWDRAANECFSLGGGVYVIRN